MAHKNRELAVQLLGGFGVRRGQRRLNLRPSARRLVALLAVEGASARSDVAARLFEDHTFERASANLRTIMWRVRKDASGLIFEEADGLWIDADYVDLDEVLRWSQATIQREASLASPPPQIGRELLPGWGEPWLVAPREHLHMLQLHALEASAERLLMAGRFGEAAANALCAVSMDNLRETSNRLLIEILIREGNIADGLRRYREYERMFSSEMNAKPGIAMQTLVAPLLAAGYIAPDRR
ncbi:DNA-binding SARP family transcriptional activator [Kribbella sp. VKM Ac-2527]|uniref:DNA-binding SARP family transcriptional activator n=1 Tax=Kribbella caucasensis TaxID=2512215 RepID=A0A4R6J5D2_9ACTN|nr:BTAD domain-containing putative transcriptional regulator [Kribbella sp. VKM Ac-2527]TDO30247.1 DNA-binding SARP family transcriptional activator [Kribbella sp. VKM Ac-2527]